MNALRKLFTVLLLLCAAVVSAHDFEVSGIYYKITDATNYTVEVVYKGDSYSEYSDEYTGSVVIPENVTYNNNSYSVTTIGWNTFNGCSGLTDIVIPNSVTSIGNYAFSACTSLNDLHIEDGGGTLSLGYNKYSINGIGEGAFYDCPIETLYLGRELSYSTDFRSGLSPFRENTTLKFVTIGDSVKNIGCGVFDGCSGLTKVVIGASVTSIDSNAFYECLCLEEVHISDLSAWCKIDFNDYSANPLYYAKNLYLNNELVTELVIPDDITEIKQYAFYNCSGLTSVTISSGVISIGNYVFNGCTSLRDLRIEDGEGTLSLGYNASSKGLFYDCPLQTLYIGRDLSYNSKSSYGYSPFYKKSTLKNITIGNNVTSIGNYAFRDCSGLTSVVIGTSVTSIGSNAFYECLCLEEVHISDLSAWCKIDFNDYSANPLYYANNLYLNNELVTELVIPNDITEIKQYAFYNCSGLTGKLVIPNSVITIGNNAFRDCFGLTGELVIPNNVTTIGDYAFYNCSGLTGELVIPNSVTTIGNNAFNNCSLTGELVIGNSVTTIGSNAFNNCFGLTVIVIGASVTDIGDSAFNSAAAVYDIVAEIPAKLGSKVFASNAVFVVPDASLVAYKTAWNDYEARISGHDDAFVEVDVVAMAATSGIMEEIGVDKMTSIIKLRVKGSINSYDIIQFRDKMPLLRELDLSEATVVASDKAFYNGNCTKDKNLGGYAFYGLSKLNYVKLPKDLVAIGEFAFNGCSSLRELIIPNSVTTIGSSAFYGCSSLKEIAIPAGVDRCCSNVFKNCSSLEKVVLPDGLEVTGDCAFYGCWRLKDIKLPPTVKRIESQAFYNCSSLEEIRIPSSMQSIGDSAFCDCKKLNKVYTYTVEPTTIQENTFSTFATATLYVPSFSFSNYYWDDGWKRFLKLVDFNEPYEYFYVNNDYILNDDTGYINGTEGNAPDADINAGGAFVVEGEQGDDEEPNQSLGGVNVGSNGEGTCGSIIGDNNLHIDDLHIKITVKGGHSYFFAFPFDINFNDISMENDCDYVFRYYDGDERATSGNSVWKDVNENHLKAARGYIFQCSANDVLVLSIKDVKFKKEDKYNELVAHVSENLKDANWNFVGNPYLSYYDLADMDYEAPVTVWDGEKYVAIRLGDDDYHFAPYEAFLVQKPEGQDCINYDGEGQMTQNQSEAMKEKKATAHRTRGINPERKLINLVLSNATSNDRTRIVFNEYQSLNYEIACDATKFFTANIVQFYSTGRDNVHYAINERPADNGRVVLGYTVPTAGLYTIAADRMDAVVFVRDFKTGIIHSLTDGAYSFSTDAGTFNDRFEILLSDIDSDITYIDEVEGEDANVENHIYDLQGRKMNDIGKGIYILNGEKVVK